jgi:stage III sporulation protein AE
VKRVVIFTIVLLLLWSNYSIATSSKDEMLDVSSFINEAKKYTENIFEDVDFTEVLNSAISGDVDNSTIIKKILNLFGIEIKSQIKMIGSIIVVIVVHSILKSISDGLENDEVSKIAYFVQYILIITLIMQNFSAIITSIKETTQNLVGFSYSLIPLLLALMMITGNIVTASVVQPVLLMLITFIGTFISTFLLPLIFIGTSLGIISQISEKIQISRLANTLKSSSVWILGIVMTVFTGVLSLESSLTGHVDSITTKTTKNIVSSAIPVVGKILSDTTETLLGSGVILKNAVGFVGVIVIIGICATPIIKLTVLTLLYQVLSAICEPLADKKILNIIEQMKDTFKTLLGMISAISVMLIIGVTIVIRISNI